MAKTSKRRTSVRSGRVPVPSPVINARATEGVVLGAAAKAIGGAADTARTGLTRLQAERDRTEQALEKQAYRLEEQNEEFRVTDLVLDGKDKLYKLQTESLQNPNPDDARAIWTEGVEKIMNKQSGLAKTPESRNRVEQRLRVSAMAMAYRVESRAASRERATAKARLVSSSDTVAKRLATLPPALAKHEGNEHVNDILFSPLLSDADKIEEVDRFKENAGKAREEYVEHQAGIATEEVYRLIREGKAHMVAGYLNNPREYPEVRSLTNEAKTNLLSLTEEPLEELQKQEYSQLVEDTHRALTKSMLANPGTKDLEKLSAGFALVVQNTFDHPQNDKQKIDIEYDYLAPHIKTAARNAHDTRIGHLAQADFEALALVTHANPKLTELIATQRDQVLEPGIKERDTVGKGIDLLNDAFARGVYLHERLPTAPPVANAFFNRQLSLGHGVPEILSWYMGPGNDGPLPPAALTMLKGQAKNQDYKMIFEVGIEMSRGGDAMDIERAKFFYDSLPHAKLLQAGLQKILMGEDPEDVTAQFAKRGVLEINDLITQSLDGDWNDLKGEWKGSGENILEPYDFRKDIATKLRIPKDAQTFHTDRVMKDLLRGHIIDVMFVREPGKATVKEALPSAVETALADFKMLFFAAENPGTNNLTVVETTPFRGQGRPAEEVVDEWRSTLMTVGQAKEVITVWDKFFAHMSLAFGGSNRFSGNLPIVNKGLAEAQAAREDEARRIIREDLWSPEHPYEVQMNNLVQFDGKVYTPVVNPGGITGFIEYDPQAFFKARSKGNFGDFQTGRMIDFAHDPHLFTGLEKKLQGVRHPAELTSRSRYMWQESFGNLTVDEYDKKHNLKPGEGYVYRITQWALRDVTRMYNASDRELPRDENDNLTPGILDRVRLHAENLAVNRFNWRQGLGVGLGQATTP